MGTVGGCTGKTSIGLTVPLKLAARARKKIKYKNDILKSELEVEMRRRQRIGPFDPDDLIVYYIGDTITSKVRKGTERIWYICKGSGPSCFQAYLCKRDP